jgi:hypothetical protein
MRTLVATAVVLLLVAAPAVAQTVNPTEQGYSAPAGTTQQQITSTPSPSAQVSPGTTAKVTPVAAKKAVTPTKSSGLPFTGLELGLVLAAGAGLLAFGLALRRLSRPSQAA